MQPTARRLFVPALVFASFGLLASCSAGSTGDASPPSLPLREMTPSVAETPATAESTPAEAVAPGLTAEMFESMLETDGGRNLLIGGITAETNLTTDEATCLLHAIPIDVLVEAAGAFLGPDSEANDTFFSVDQAADVTPLLESCNIAAEDLLP